MRRRKFIALLGSTATTWPLAVLAQQQPSPTVGVIIAGNRNTSLFPKPFLQSMRQLGWEQDRNYRPIFVGTEGHNEQYPRFVSDLIAEGANVIVVFGNPGIEAARRATASIPIVAVADDLVQSGFAASMARPGGNITGVSIFGRELNVKRLEILHEAVPATKRIGILADPTGIAVQPQLDHVAHDLHLDLFTVSAGSPEEVARALDALEAAHIDAVNVLSSPVLANVRSLIIERLNGGHLPAIYEWPEAAAEGGLLGYGARFQRAIFPKVAVLVDRVLRGAQPKDLPIEQPEKIDLVVNLKTAKSLGLTIPPSLLAQADEVIE
jgi:putative ABC transport system substrate-binding protein